MIISSKEADTNIVEVNEEWLKTTSICAQKLQVKVENLVGETITNKNISGGTLLVGNKDEAYTEITSDGVLNCNKANIFGTVTTDNLTVTGGVICGWTLEKEVTFDMPVFSQSYTGAAFTYSWNPEEGRTYTAYLTPVGVYATKTDDATQEMSSKFHSWWDSI